MLLAFAIQIKSFNFIARPRRAAQKLKARFDTGITAKAANINAICQTIPTVVVNQFSQELFQGNTVKQIVRLFLAHALTLDYDFETGKGLKLALFSGENTLFALLFLSESSFDLFQHTVDIGLITTIFKLTG